VVGNTKEYQKAIIVLPMINFIVTYGWFSQPFSGFQSKVVVYLCQNLDNAAAFQKRIYFLRRRHVIKVDIGEIVFRS
jgi:hypothetical protein